MQQEEFLREVKSIGFTGQTVEEIICGQSQIKPDTGGGKSEHISDQIANMHLKDLGNQARKSLQENQLTPEEDKDLKDEITYKQKRRISQQMNLRREKKFQKKKSQKSGAERISLAARDLNLLSELVGYVKNSRSLNKKQPIKLEELGWEKERLKRMKTLQTVREDLVRIARESFQNDIGNLHFNFSPDKSFEFVFFFFCKKTIIKLLNPGIS